MSKVKVMETLEIMHLSGQRWSLTPELNVTEILLCLIIPRICTFGNIKL